MKVFKLINGTMEEFEILDSLICQQHDWEVKGEDRKLIVQPYEGHPHATKYYQYVLVLACKKCGKLDKTIERIRGGGCCYK